MVRSEEEKERIREQRSVARTPRPPQVIIVTSSLMKDMNSTVDLYRANAVRVLCQIVDSQLLAQIERYLKQAVVDKSPVVAASVLCCAVHLMAGNSDIIKRWVNEVQEAVQVRAAVRAAPTRHHRERPHSLPSPARRSGG